MLQNAVCEVHHRRLSFFVGFVSEEFIGCGVLHTQLLCFLIKVMPRSSSQRSSYVTISQNLKLSPA